VLDALYSTLLYRNSTQILSLPYGDDDGLLRTCLRMNQLRGGSEAPVNRPSRPQLSSLRTLLPILLSTLLPILLSTLLLIPLLYGLLPILLSTLLLIPLLYGLLASSHAFDQLRHILLVF
jgi:hypothetical protein